jgi:hypothetical protein
MGDNENAGGSASDAGSAAGAASSDVGSAADAAPSALGGDVAVAQRLPLQGNVEVRHQKEPQDGPTCQRRQPFPPLGALKAALDNTVTKRKPHQASASNTRLKTGVTQTGTPPPGSSNVNLPGPLQAKTDQSPPHAGNVQVDVPYSPLKPRMGQLVPTNVTKVPPGWLIVPDPKNPNLRYLVPNEAVPNDDSLAWIIFIIVTFMTGGADVPVVAGLPKPLPAPPPQPLEKVVEWVWVYTRKDGTKIIWRKGSTWFGKTNTGEWMKLEDAIKVGRFPLDLYNQLTHGGGIGF